MNLIRKGHGHSHRGVIGVESAIVMIAFVIVAAALAFVVLNMGFSTTQKAKTTIISGLSEASSSLEVSGKVTGIGDVSAAVLNVTSVPIKIASGGDSVNLDPSLTSIKYLSNSVEYDNIYECVVDDSATYVNVTAAFTGAGDDTDCGSFDNADVNHPVLGGRDTASDPTKAVIYWTVNTAGSANAILDQGEHAVISIAYEATSGSDERPAALDKIRAEVLVPTGAPLTIERQVPNITNLVVDMG